MSGEELEATRVVDPAVEKARIEARSLEVVVEHVGAIVEAVADRSARAQVEVAQVQAQAQRDAQKHAIDLAKAQAPIHRLALIGAYVLAGGLLAGAVALVLNGQGAFVKDVGLVVGTVAGVGAAAHYRAIAKR